MLQYDNKNLLLLLLLFFFYYPSTSFSRSRKRIIFLILSFFSIFSTWTRSAIYMVGEIM